jgi:hypothetical protein
MKNEPDANEGRLVLFISAILSGAANIAFEAGQVLMH